MTGIVVNEETGLPLPNASIFINNTSLGTTANNLGEFSLDVPINGTYDLIASSIGYESGVYNFNSANLPLRIRFQLNPKVKEEEAVVVESGEAVTWEKWGAFFTREFIGQMKFAHNIEIKNKNAIKLRYYRKQNKLKAYADEPLLIKNNALGYTITYSLENFEANMNANYITYYGYPLFTDESKQKHKEKWVSNRKKAFNGSLQHFMQSLFHNKVAENGWQIRYMYKRQNELKKYYTGKLRNYLKEQHNKGLKPDIQMDVMYRKIFGDSSEIIKKIIKGPNEIVTYGANLLTADSICKTINSVTKSLYFKESLSVIFTLSDPEENFYNQNKQIKGQVSELFMAKDEPIFIEKNGNYNPFLNLVLLGYFGWREKLGMLIPLDAEINIEE